MAICLKIKHTDGLRLRQQVASVQARAGDGAVIKGAQWHFEKDPITKRDAEVPRDLDQRSRKPLDTSTVYVSYGLKNLVIDRKGVPAGVDLFNSSLRNSLKVQIETLTEVKTKGDEKKVQKEWVPSGPPAFIAPMATSGVIVGDGVRAILNEVPT
jgi:hypothetical protein